MVAKGNSYRGISDLQIFQRNKSGLFQTVKFHLHSFFRIMEEDRIVSINISFQTLVVQVCAVLLFAKIVSEIIFCVESKYEFRIDPHIRILGFLRLCLVKTAFFRFFWIHLHGSFISKPTTLCQNSWRRTTFYNWSIEWPSL